MTNQCCSASNQLPLYTFCTKLLTKLNKAIKTYTSILFSTTVTWLYAKNIESIFGGLVCNEV